MKATLLGTGTSQGVPVIGCHCEVCSSTNPHDKRLRSAVHIEQGRTSIVIDIGPDFRQQMLTYKVDHLDAILLTHEHNDHIVGLDEVRPFNFRQGSSMAIYGSERVFHQIKQRFGYIFAEEKYPGSPDVDYIQIHNDSILNIGSLEIQVIGVMHGKLPVFGFRSGGFCYITDAKTIDQREFPKLKGIEVLVINALHHRTHHSHLNLEEAIVLAKRIQPKVTYFTHVSHYMGLYGEVDHDLPDGMHLGFDGLTFEFKD